MSLCHLCHLCWAEELPLPADVFELDEPVEVLTAGAQPLTVQSFSTRLTPDHLRVFYTDALPRVGWKVQPLEWMAQAQQQLAEVNRNLDAHRDVIEQDPQLQARIAQLQQYSPAELARHQLHAVRGDQHMILHMTEDEKGRTQVFVNRWQGASTPFGDLEGVGGSPCCSDEEVPSALRTIPQSVPEYPNARRIGTAAAAKGPGLTPTSEMYFSNDSIDQVVAYYRQHMAYNGWTSVRDAGMNDPAIREVLGSQAASMKASVLSYRSKHAYCGIIVAEHPDVTAMAADAEAPEPGSDERTVILVTYLAIPSPERPPVYAPRGVGGAR